MSDKSNLAVIAGNGLSIAYSDDLLLSRITEKLLFELERLVPGKNPVLDVLKEIAQRASDPNKAEDEDFEHLVGAFETQASVIEQLESLIGLLPEREDRLRESLNESADFARRIKEIGTGIVLKTILQNSHTSDKDIAHLDPFFLALGSSFSGEITFGNLNYDPLVMRSMLKLEQPFCDLADFRRRHTLSIVDDEKEEGEPIPVATFECAPLRTETDFPNHEHYRIRLLHMHGSVMFWREKKTGELRKIPIGPVRDFELLADVGEKRKMWEPVVVLANTLEKPKRVLESPFNLGYKAMKNGLRRSEHWLIVGYSFADDSVNSILEDEFKDRVVKPSVLVSTFGEDLSRTEIERKMGWSADDGPSEPWLLIDRSGVVGLTERDVWPAFTHDKGGRDN